MICASALLLFQHSAQLRNYSHIMLNILVIDSRLARNYVEQYWASIGVLHHSKELHHVANIIYTRSV